MTKDYKIVINLVIQIRVASMGYRYQKYNPYTQFVQLQTCTI